ncbi:hypothetical protein OIV83_005129 [Microbotryomycetes sp. JL201]|nr:hypothetical protein OIV83_005129 [Microbotryomycetes sp. JL201]
MMAQPAVNPTMTNGSTHSNSTKSRGQLKRLKKKQAKGAAAFAPSHNTIEQKGSSAKTSTITNHSNGTHVSESAHDVSEDSGEYVVEQVDAPSEFASVFAHFQPSLDDEQAGEGQDGVVKGEVIYSDDDMPSDQDDEDAPKLSKRKQRKANRLSVAELKRLVRKPEVVEWVDVSATDPKLLVQIKSHRNTVPIPPHWSQKRDYLQGKRGIEKPPFQLPSFIADTGIATQRDAIKEKEEQQSLKAKTRERVQPKMGKIDIDYQKLHDAFFKYQTKPKMTDFGETYYEGKEFETKLSEKRPGDLSEELKEALSIPPLAPPPWLISMQRYGPPPSYANLRIPGLNAPIPEGRVRRTWGFHPGGWGKPPLDEYGRPLYGDIYGVQANSADAGIEPVNKSIWGELEPEEEGKPAHAAALLEESEEESEAEEDAQEDASAGQQVPSDGSQTPSGLETPSGLASVTSTVPGGLDTPAFLDLRKQRESTEAEDGPRSLYQVIPERDSRIRGLMGSDRVYDMSVVAGGGAPVLGQDERGTKRKAGGVDVAIDVADLEGLSETDLRARYEEATRRGTAPSEDFSDFVSKEVAKRRKTETRRKDAKEKEKFKF